ncbi:MAG: SapC family protein [Pseudomonadota bacterium]
MSQTPTNAAPSVEGSMFLFRKPELLTKESHGTIGIDNPDQPFAFAAAARAVPLVLTELTTAMRDYPIIFSNKETPMPLAVLGLIEDDNLLVDEKGEWEHGRYVPGYIRRYPFALATEREATDPEGQRMALIVDGEFEGLSTSVPEDKRFFDDNGPSSALQQAMDFCQNYERDRAQTIQFGEILAGYDILTEQFGQYTPPGETSQPFARYVGVDENKLKQLPADKYIELRDNGMLPLLFAHMMSMGNWGNILDRRARRYNLSGADVIKPRASN